MAVSVSLRVVRWAAQECEWQASGEWSVSWMVEGWSYARRNRNRRITFDHVLWLGELVEPRHNLAGLRHVDVRVGTDVKLPHAQVPTALRRLLSAPQLPDAATEWFKEYEDIHPFRDGNGRTGSILYNWLRGTLLEPTHPPNLWHDRRRDRPGYPDPDEIAWQERK